MEREKRFRPTIRESPKEVAQDGNRFLVVKVANVLSIPRAVIFTLVRHIAPDNEHKPLEARRSAQKPMHLSKLTMLLKDEVGTRGILINHHDLIEGKTNQGYSAQSKKRPQKTLVSVARAREYDFAGKTYSWNNTDGGGPDYSWKYAIGKYGERLIPPLKIIEQVEHLYNRTHRGGRTSNFSECLNVLVRGGFIQRDDDDVNLTELGADFAMRYYGELRDYIHLDVRFFEEKTSSSTEHLC